MAWKFNPFTGALDYFEPAGGGGAVSSVNTRTGAVTGLAENADLVAHTSSTANPHSVTKAQVGLSNVPNTDFTSAVTANTAKISMAIGNTVTSATAGSILFAGAAGVLAQDNPNLFWDNTNNRLGIGTATPAYLLDIKKVGHNPTFTGPGDLVYRMVDNDSSGGRDSNLNLYHQYFPSQAIDVYSFLNTNGYAGGVDFSLGFGSTYGTSNLFIKGGGIAFEDSTAALIQSSATRLNLALNGANGSFNITRPGGDDTNLQFTPSAGLRVQGNYESVTLSQTSQALGGTVLTPLSAANRPLIVRGFAAQTADLAQWQDSASTVLTKVKSDGNLEVPDQAYGAGWNGSLEVPTKNAVYDKIETLASVRGITEVDFGPTEQGEAVVTIVDAAITATSYPSVTVYALATADHDPDDYMAEGLTAYVTNVVAGVGFDIAAGCNDTTWGKYAVTFAY